MLQTNHNFIVQNFEERVYKTQIQENPIINYNFKEK